MGVEQMEDKNTSLSNRTLKAFDTKDVQDMDGKHYDSLEKLIIEKLNGVAEFARLKAQRDEYKPKYKFLENTKTDIKDVRKKVRDLDKKLKYFKYKVKVIEKIENLNANENRYTVRVENEDAVYYEISLLEYQEMIKDFDFDEELYWSRVITKIEGYYAQRKELADIIAEYLSYIIYFKEFYTLVYSKIGWQLYENHYIFKYDKIISNNKIRGESVNKEDTLKLGEDTFKERVHFVKHTIQLLNKHTYDALILSIGISGLVRSLLVYSKETSLNVNLMGVPAIGKSTMCHFLLSFFGNPKNLEGTFTSTDNGVEEIRVERSILPYVLDERMLKFQSVSRRKRENELLLAIFREYEGRNKDRFGVKSAGNERAYGPVISTSTESMMDILLNENSKDYGQYRRFIEFKLKGTDLFSSNQEARDTEFLAYSVYGIGLKILVEYMLEILNDEKKGREYIQNEFDTITGEIDEDLEKEENNDILKLRNSSGRFALILYSYKILKLSLEYYISNIEKDRDLLKAETYKKYKCSNAEEFEALYNEIKVCVINDMSGKIYNILKENLVNKMSYANVYESYELNPDLYQYVLRHKDKFLLFRKKSNIADIFADSSEYIGMYNEKGKNQLQIFTKPKYALEQFFCMNEIPEPDTILKYIKEIDNIPDDDKQELSIQEKKLQRKYNTNTRAIKKVGDRTNKKTQSKFLLLTSFIVSNDSAEGDRCD